jgi:RNA recognition motif-containing protein
MAAQGITDMISAYLCAQPNNRGSPPGQTNKTNKDQNSMNLFINNLAWATTEEDLLGLLSQYGEVSSVKIIVDKFTQRSKGFAFAEMPDNDAANKAIAELNGANVKGRNINVNEARPKTERPSNFDRRDRY